MTVEPPGHRGVITPSALRQMPGDLGLTQMRQMRAALLAAFLLCMKLRHGYRVPRLVKSSKFINGNPGRLLGQPRLGEIGHAGVTRGKMR